jgi:hypothetical protein
MRTWVITIMVCLLAGLFVGLGGSPAKIRTEPPDKYRIVGYHTDWGMKTPIVEFLDTPIAVGGDNCGVSTAPNAVTIKFRSHR